MLARGHFNGSKDLGSAPALAFVSRYAFTQLEAAPEFEPSKIKLPHSKEKAQRQGRAAVPDSLSVSRLGNGRLAFSSFHQDASVHFSDQTRAQLGISCAFDDSWLLLSVNKTTKHAARILTCSIEYDSTHTIFYGVFSTINLVYM